LFLPVLSSTPHICRGLARVHVTFSQARCENEGRSAEEWKANWGFLVEKQAEVDHSNIEYNRGPFKPALHMTVKAGTMPIANCMIVDLIYVLYTLPMPCHLNDLRWVILYFIA
jgi:hypothetical protein